MQKSSNYKIGIDAEEKAAELLRAKGFEIVAVRVGIRRGMGAGEIDIVAAKGKTLVFVEVKKRASIGLALESITARQQARVYRAAEVFLAKNPQYSGFDCGFDAIVFDSEGEFQHIENAWGF